MTNWRTSVFGTLTLLAAFLTQFPELLDSLLDPALAKKIAAGCALVTGFLTFANSKDRQVSGNGTLSDPNRVPANDGTGMSKILPLAALCAGSLAWLGLLWAPVLLTSCATDTADAARNRRNSIANALLLDSAKVLGKAAFGVLQGVASQELTGQDADWGHAAAKTLWSSSLSLSDFGDVSDAINAATQNRIPDVAAHAAEAFAMAAPQTPAEKTATVNAIAGTLSGVSMKAAR